MEFLVIFLRICCTLSFNIFSPKIRFRGNNTNELLEFALRVVKGPFSLLRRLINFKRKFLVCHKKL
jgi:hypothetical protein